MTWIRIPSTESYDVAVVGAGIVGLAHAAWALDAGLRVLLLERDQRAVGASVRNFGHVCVTGQAGELRELATIARQRWLDLGRRAGLAVRETGGVVVARGSDELAVLEELSGRGHEGLGLLTAAQVRQRLGGCGADDIVGGAELGCDLRVDPRVAAHRLAAWLADQPGVDVLFRTNYLGFDGDTVHTSRGGARCQRVIVCVGHDLDYLYPELAETHDVARCALQMARVQAPGGVVIDPAVLTATSLLRYSAFAGTDAAQALRARVAAARPDLLDIEANVMLTQRPDGTLIIGDSHHTEPTTDVFLSEHTSDTLHRAICEVLGVDQLNVHERWQGVYASSPRGDYLVAELGDRVSVRVVTAGVGMTIAFGLAQRHFPGAGA
ncbi:TIGR03364 family FAD-dependent oxidoreductase [Mycobacterium spongiae]|uniref:TIGR03364 family FAD-dependent oxidoreductase n=1 Tax=Mycobacterium spongiae TaxID=886343 RepID=UPI001FE8E990|nr:TIGR03364 family FAD-dependent oxidoreductase [Mycobacterium spongiae]